MRKWNCQSSEKKTEQLPSKWAFFWAGYFSILLDLKPERPAWKAHCNRNLYYYITKPSYSIFQGNNFDGCCISLLHLIRSFLFSSKSPLSIQFILLHKLFNADYSNRKLNPLFHRKKWLHGLEYPMSFVISLPKFSLFCWSTVKHRVLALQ